MELLYIFVESAYLTLFVSVSILVVAADCCGCCLLSGGFGHLTVHSFGAHRRCRRFCLVAFETHMWLSGSAFELQQSYFILSEDQLM